MNAVIMIFRQKVMDHQLSKRGKNLMGYKLILSAWVTNIDISYKFAHYN